MTPKAIYTVVLSNRHNLKSQLNVDFENVYFEKETVDSDYKSKSDVSTNSNSSNDFATASDQEMIFLISLSEDEWNKIKPRECEYKRKNRTRIEVCLAPYLWTHILYAHFWNVTKLPCVLNFKRARFTVNGKNFINILGKCQECDSSFKRKMEEELKGKNIKFNCTYFGKFKTTLHNQNKKRFLSGSNRTAIGKILDNDNISSSVHRQLEKNKIMQFGDSEPANFYAAKYTENLFHEDPILALVSAKDMIKYNGIIRNIGYSLYYMLHLDCGAAKTNRIPRPMRFMQHVVRATFANVA